MEASYWVSKKKAQICKEEVRYLEFVLKQDARVQSLVGLEFVLKKDARVQTLVGSYILMALA